jgi:hypothetical protein
MPSCPAVETTGQASTGMPLLANYSSAQNFQRNYDEKIHAAPFHLLKPPVGRNLAKKLNASLKIL